MYVDKEMREKLSALSAEIWGRKSIWRKLLQNGYLEPVKYSNSDVIRWKERKHYSPQSLLDFMLETKAKIEEAKKAEADKNAVNSGVGN